jgi:hypothetical protein
LPSDATALNWIEYGSAEPGGSFQLHLGNAGSTTSSVVSEPTPIDVRFQNESAIGSSRPVARSYAWHGDPADAALGEAGREVVAAAGVGDG